VDEAPFVLLGLIGTVGWVLFRLYRSQVMSLSKHQDEEVF